MREYLKPQRRNAVDMLRQLPSIFDIKDVMSTFAMKRTTATQYCVRWKEKDLVSSMGAENSRLGIFHNTLNPSSNPIKEVIERVVRAPHVVIGKSSLNQGALTSQVAKIIEVAVPTNEVVKSYPSVAGVKFILRPQSWFNSVLPNTYLGLNGLTTADPCYALVDTLRSRDLYSSDRVDKVWHVAPDDIELMDDLEERQIIAKCYEAAYELGVEIDIVTEYLSQIDDLSGYVEDIDPDNIGDILPSFR